MSHQSVVLLMEDVTKSLGDNLQFGYGRRSDFNLIQSKALPFVWLLPLTANPIYTNNNNTENYQKQWNCIVFFAAADKPDSTETEYKPILDQMDVLLDKFINRLNDFYLKGSDTVGPLTIRNLTQTPFFKSDAAVLTGWFLSFQLIVSDDFIYCTPDNIALYDA
jgi:hypothetical protein